MTFPDDHGRPPLSSRHGVCAASPGTADAYDWNFCWRTWDALRNAAYFGTDRDLALGDTPENRNLGVWSDGVPIVSLEIQDHAPITP